MTELEMFLEYAAVFLANVGNYYVSHCQLLGLLVLAIAEPRDRAPAIRNSFLGCQIHF